MPDTPIFDVLRRFANDPAHGWSIGSFGAIGEFVRDPDEPADIAMNEHNISVATARGAMRLTCNPDLVPIAWDSLSADGESWGHSFALCCPCPPTPERVIRALGPDNDAIRNQDKPALLFDLGVGTGAVRMALRTQDKAMIEAMTQAEGKPFAGDMDLMAEVLRAQPHRIMLSPAGRIEVYQNVPPPDGKSPEGPHTHLIAKLIPLDRPHSSNTPIAEGMQSAVYLHPRSPWRTLLGERHDFESSADEAFQPYLTAYGLQADLKIAADLGAAVEQGISPQDFSWPDTRRGRTKARITLRRLATRGAPHIAEWRAIYDRGPIETDIEGQPS